jgi:hypothetical protein
MKFYLMECMLTGMTEFVVNIFEIAVNFTSTSNK